MKICIIEGPLLDKVGTREPSVYGSFTRDDLVRTTLEKAGQLSVSIEFMNSYLEGELAGLIAGCKCDGMVLNPGAYTHTSVLIRDAALCSGIPFVEAHLTNIFGREDFRHRSFLRRHRFRFYLRARDIYLCFCSRGTIFNFKKL